jgi:phosphoribosyl-ATP pyrophosphohydrolase
MSDFTLADLERIVAERAAASPDESWTAKLMAGGPSRIAKKLGEEAIETALAAVGEDKAALVNESADLLYHLVVLLQARGASVQAVLDELARRTAQSGLAVKASRPRS